METQYEPFVVEPYKMFVLAQNYYPILYKAGRITRQGNYSEEMYEKMHSVSDKLAEVHAFNLGHLRYRAMYKGDVDPRTYYDENNVLRPEYVKIVEDIYEADKEVYDEMYDKFARGYIVY